MSETEWLVSDDPAAMLAYVSGMRVGPGSEPERSPRYKASERKLRLFACACCRRCYGPTTAPEELERWEEGEVFADDPGSVSDSSLSGNRLVTEGGDRLAVWAARRVGLVSYEPDRPDPAKADLLRDIVGNPWWQAKLAVCGCERKTAWPKACDHCCLRGQPACLTPQALSLANAAYDDRRPGGTLDPASLAVLSDALEEAGCGSVELLAHLRSQGPHVRGCWALDLVLGKE
jgi:hypothetical protein